MLRSILAALLLVFFAISPLQSYVSYTVPNFPDLMIRTRTTLGIQHPMMTTLYLKGPRQRIEHGPYSASKDGQPFLAASIMQCDEGAFYHLSQFSKTYTVFYNHHRDLPDHPARPVHILPAPAPNGAEVVFTIDSVDTGERRDYGSYQARHVKTTITIEPGKGAESRPGRADIDGWYIDLPGLYCHEEQMESLLPPMMMMRPSIRDHRVIKHLGTAPHGFTVAETARIKENGNTIINKTELVTVSEDQLDPALFEVPQGYTEREPPLFHGTVVFPLGQDILRPTP